MPVARLSDRDRCYNKRSRFAQRPNCGYIFSQPLKIAKFPSGKPIEQRKEISKIQFLEVAFI